MFFQQWHDIIAAEPLAFVALLFATVAWFLADTALRRTNKK